MQTKPNKKIFFGKGLIKNHILKSDEDDSDEKTGEHIKGTENFYMFRVH